MADRSTRLRRHGENAGENLVPHLELGRYLGKYHWPGRAEEPDVWIALVWAL